MDMIKIRGLIQNNLKNIDLDIQKHKITIFTGVSGSGKSSIVFDTIAAVANRQMNETYPAFIKGKLPQYKKPNLQSIINLSPAVVIDQSSLGGNSRSTVGTASDLLTDLRVLFSRIGSPYLGSASCFSFNDPKGMCLECSGLGTVMTLDIDKIIDFTKSLNEGCIKDSTYAPNTWYWRQYAESKLFDLDKPICNYSREEKNLLFYGSKIEGGEQENTKVIGIIKKYRQTYLTRDLSGMSKTMKEKAKKFTSQSSCTCCGGNRFNQEVLECKINGYSIADMCELELTELLRVIKEIKNEAVFPLLDSLQDGIKRMIDIGLSYLHLNRETNTLSGGEAQRLKLVRYMGSSLSDLLYIFDEPSTGMHPDDVKKINQLMIHLKNQGNTVLIVEHEKEVIKIADEIIDVGMYAGEQGGEIVFKGSYKELLKSETLTAKAMSQIHSYKKEVRKKAFFYKIKNATRNNLHNVTVDIPAQVLTVITGVAGSGKSTLISEVFAEIYKEEVILVNQKPIFSTNRSTPVTFLGAFDEIRSIFAKENKVDKGYFSFNSKGACEECKGKGVHVIELVHMSPVISTCESCGGGRYNKYARSLTYRNKNILDILSMKVEEALYFFKETKVYTKLLPLKRVGLSYLSLGQPLSTLSGGEVQRIKLAFSLNKKGKIYILDEPTKGLHSSDVHKLMNLFNILLDKENTLLVIEHNLEVIKQGDWIIDIGPKGGKNGGEIIFQGTPEQMIKTSNTLTAKCLRESLVPQ